MLASDDLRGAEADSDSTSDGETLTGEELAPVGQLGREELAALDEETIEGEELAPVE